MIKRLIIFIFFVFAGVSFAGNIDSLKLSLKNEKRDTVVLRGYLKLGKEYFYNGLVDSSIHYYKIGLERSGALKLPDFICSFYLETGLVYREKGIYDIASEYLFKALRVADEHNFELKKASCYNGIAIIYAIQKQFDNAIEYYNKAMVIYIKKGNLSGQASINNNIGLIYMEKKDYEHALSLFHKAKGFNIKTGNDYGLAANYENIGLINEGQKNYDSSHIYLVKAYNIWKARKDTHSLAINLSYFGNSLIIQKKYKYAIDTLSKALYLAKRIDVKSTKRELSLYLATAYENLGDYKNALNYFKYSKQIADSLLNDDKKREMTEMQINYSFNKRKIQDSLNHQMEVRSKEKELINQKKNTSITLVILFVIVILLFFVFKGYREKNKANNIITEQKVLVEQKQKEILDSISYAKKIQTTLLAHQDFLNENTKENFIFFRSKDIVSGDFYWATKKDDLFYLAVCDSTGHGVPGAFMSLLNIGFINEAINEKNILEPNKIFDFVREKLIKSIGKDGQKDGFDGILLCFNKRSNKITYAAANNAPVLVSNGILTELDYDRMPVGYGEKKEEFSIFNIENSNDSTLYLYTDGYADQFGGPRGKKFKYKQLNELILKINALPLNSQHAAIEENFMNWKGNLEQVDDVCVIGIKL